MITTGNTTIGDNNFETFTVLNKGFNNENGWVRMDCRLSDMKSEGEVLFLNVSDHKVAKNGDYAPLEMDKKDLELFIEYLNKRLAELDKS